MTKYFEIAKIPFFVILHCISINQSIGQSVVDSQDQPILILTREVINSGIYLEWNKPKNLDCEDFILYRSRNSEAIQAYAILDFKKNHFYDSTAIFGNFTYQLSCKIEEYNIDSNTLQSEFYLGTDYTELSSKSAVSKGHQFNIVLGNASKNEKIFITLYNKEGDMMYSREQNLDNQLLKLSTNDLIPDTYLAFIKLKDYDFFSYKFLIQ